MNINTHIRAKVLIPVLLFLVICLPAVLVPIAMGNEAEPVTQQPVQNMEIVEQLQQKSDVEPTCTTCPLSADEIEYYLDDFLNK